MVDKISLDAIVDPRTPWDRRLPRSLTPALLRFFVALSWGAHVQASHRNLVNMSKHDPTQSKGPTVLAVSIVFTVIALIATVLRLFTRFYLIKNHGMEDYSITLATVILSDSHISPAQLTDLGADVLSDPHNFDWRT